MELDDPTVCPENPVPDIPLFASPSTGLAMGNGYYQSHFNQISTKRSWYSNGGSRKLESQENTDPMVIRTAKEIWQTNRGYIGVSVQNAQSFSDSNKH